jgi:hypothetical protein
MQKDEEGHALKIDAIVKHIYTEAVHFAERKAETAYKFCCTVNSCASASLGLGYLPSSVIAQTHRLESHRLSFNVEYVVKNMPEILMRLESLFPGCSVEYKKVSFARGTDGKEYDISTLDDKIRPFIDTRQTRTDEYVVIDWT